MAPSSVAPSCLKSLLSWACRQVRVGVELQAMGATTRKKNRQFDANAFLASIGDGRTIVSIAKKQTIFSQGDPADAVFYIQKGKIKLTVVSKTGREATLGFLAEGAFFGEGSLAGQALRMGSAAAVALLQRLPAVWWCCAALA